ncbi:MAG: hypothetical protein WCA98_11580 [Candidatus Acidiferrales bacterium]
MNETKKAANQLPPNIDVMIRDSLLLHARVLIDFYTKDQPKPDDICLSDFGVSIDQTLRGKLTKYKNPIEVHLLHLVDFRDFDYRTRNTAGRGATRGRPDWNQEAIPILDLIFGALKDVSDQASDWRQPFRDLHHATTSRYRDKSYDWPKNLCEKSDVEQYLRTLGL